MSGPFSVAACLRVANRHRSWLLIPGLAIIAGALWTVITAPSAIPDFRQLEAGVERKAAFLDFMRPLIRSGNDRVRRDRERLVAIAETGDPGWLDRRRLARLAADYGIEDADPSNPALVEQLLRRVDTVPMSLALAQSAKESGWGTSRFARNGNALFGEWCFDAGCGLMPRARAPGARHEVEAFASAGDSVDSYLHNINTHPRYRLFRLERARLRNDGERLSGTRLAETLSQYSERRDAYVEELVSLIESNDLEEPQEAKSD